MENDLTRGNPLKVILKFMLPLFIGNVFQQLYNMADTIIVGRFVGQDALAAVGSTGTIMFLVLGFSQGLSTGFTVLTSQQFGAKRPDGVRRSVANGVLLSIVMIVLMTFASVLSMRWVLNLMNTPQEIFQDALTYITIISWGIIASVSYNLFSSFLRAVGNSQIPLLFLVFSAVLNVILDLVFIIVFHMGVAGAGWATNLAQGISAILCVIYIIRKVPVLTPKRNMWRFHAWETRRQMAVGLPMALQFAITASGTMLAQAAINLFGATAVAAITAASKIQSLITQGDASMGQAIATYVGQNYGKGDVGRIKKGVHAAELTLIIYALVCAVLAVVLLRPMLGLFFAGGTDIDAIMPYARIYMYLCVIFYIPLGLIFLYRNAMQGCGYGFLPMMGGVVELACRIIVAGAAMATMNFYLAAFCDASAWLGAGIFTTIAYIFVIRKVEVSLTKRDK